MGSSHAAIGVGRQSGPAPAGWFPALVLTLILSIVTGCSPAGKSAPAPGSKTPVAAPQRTVADPLGNLAAREGRVIVADFGRNSCPSCVQMGRILDRVEPRLSEKARVMRINVDRAPDLLRIYSIRLIPTVIVFGPDGHVALRHVGVVKEEALLQILRELGAGLS